MRRYFRVSNLLATAFALLPAGPSVAQTLADGLFSCLIGDAYLGDIRITGDQYAGPAHDGAFDASYPFQIDAGTIIWGGPLGGISLAGPVVSTILTDEGNDQIGFEIMIQSDSGSFQTVYCSPE